jgi:CheY-like chemotaxis protein
MSEAGAGRGLVLVAEDVKSNAALMSLLLTNRGFRVEMAGDGEQCLAKARAFLPSLILLDIMMPKIHGIEVLRRLKADPQTAGIGVIVCTAKPYKSDQDQARELGACDVLLKPFAKEQFVETVERFFSGAQTAAPVVTATPASEAYLPRIDTSRWHYRLWGTRGSIPVSGRRFVRHGGNTSCLEVACGDEVVIVDAGSGIRELGLRLVKQGPRKVHILITHTHWDHIQGFPFFAPAYVPGFELVIYGAATFKKDLKSVLCGQLDRDYFPVQFEDMRAKFDFRTLADSAVHIGKFKISWEFTHHPAATVGFKFECQGQKLAYVSDNEFLYGYLGSPEEITLNCDVVNAHRPLVNFLKGVDLLIAEAQYTNEEYLHKIGWGHSSLSNACLLARLARAKRWVVTHHDPLHEDDFLDQKLNLTKEVLRRLDYPIEVAHGYDEMTEYM